MSQRSTASGRFCTSCSKTPKCPGVRCQTYKKNTEHIRKSWTPNHDGAHLTKVKALQKISNHHPHRNYDLETEKLKRSDLILTTFSRQSQTSMMSQCKRLEEENAFLLKQIMKIEDEAMKSATQQLHQYNRAGSNVRAAQIWTEHQIRDAQQDLELTREKGEECINGLRLQLQDCEKNIQEIQKDLQRLRDYRDRGQSVKSLQTAELQRQMRLLRELHEDQAVDVEALAQTEIKKLLDSHQKLKDSFLQGVVEQHLESLPISIKRMCVQNKVMRSEIKAYQQMIKGLQDDIKKLLETGECISKSRKETTDRLCNELLLTKPICSPDEDVVLDIPLNQPMYI